MKYFVLLLALCLSACILAPGEGESAKTQVLPKGNYPYGVQRFDDGDVTCYIYNGYNKGGISCVLH